MDGDGSHEVINPLYLSKILRSQNRIIDSSTCENHIRVIIEDNDRCIICLEDIEERNKIKPCIVCETFMDKECLREYISHNGNTVKCPTCKGRLLNIERTPCQTGEAKSCLLTTCGIFILVSSMFIFIYPLFMLRSDS